MPAIRSLISISSRVESPARGARRAWRGARAGPGARCAPGPGAAASGSRRPNHESPSVTGLTECQCHLGSRNLSLGPARGPAREFGPLRVAGTGPAAPGRTGLPGLGLLGLLGRANKFASHGPVA